MYNQHNCEAWIRQEGVAFLQGLSAGGVDAGFLDLRRGSHVGCHGASGRSSVVES